ncbi:jg2548 [Pararge aegeria aegeria]|uniref:Jg2548 protein n=1 Tax=Pararge aegeria aegeria TaxID=348720 RepID=A0A8S4R0E8_9NEOP|nr:jg2548 [Pararge aegeria aegeria]
MKYILTSSSCMNQPENETGAARLEDLHLDKCRLEDSACLIKAFQNAIPTFSKGLPEWGVDVMDVMEFDDDVKFDIAGFSLRFANGRLKGYRNIILNTVKWDTKNQTVYVDYTAPTFALSGTYAANGRIFSRPIIGDGDIKLQIKNIIVKILLFINTYKKNNKTYVCIKDYKYDFNVEGSARYNLTNLFNGNKELSDVALKFINTYSKEITHEFGRPLMDSVGSKVFRNVDRFLARAPLEDISYSYQ